MTLGEFALGLLRLAAILLPVLITAHGLRVRYLSVQGPLAVLAEAVLALSVLLVGAQALGLFSLDQADALIALFVLIALLSRVLPRRPVGNRDGAPGPDRGEDEPVSPRGLAAISAFAAITMVAGQWLLQTANALGAGMFNFDTLWYHMPFAARFAQTGSVTAIQFTQADPFVAYYPANSELLHAIGIIALHGDFLSPALNLMWLGVALVASWCLGRPWRVAPQTLIAGCLVISLPVLSGTQPGEAFNDTAGLAMLLGAAALLANAPENSRILALAGLALGLAAGTKFTFIVPALVLVGATALHGARGRRGRVMMLLGAPAALTGGWWYLRDLIAVGNPLGARLSIGPLVLPGPASPLARASQQTVISEVSHISLWGSRFAPGLDHALGPLWPLVLGACLASVLAAIVLARDPIVRALALTAALTGISYLFLPTGATGLEQGTTQFQVNLRYATPALALCLLLVPILVRLRFTRALAALGPTLALVLVATQLDSLWPTQTARHLSSSSQPRASWRPVSGSCASSVSAPPSLWPRSPWERPWWCVRGRSSCSATTSIVDTWPAISQIQGLATSIDGRRGSRTRGSPCMGASSSIRSTELATPTASTISARGQPMVDSDPSTAVRSGGRRSMPGDTGTWS
jgi:hypothetical protein